MEQPTVAYKLCPVQDYELALREGKLLPAPVDERDNFMHLSCAKTARRTSELYFANVEELAILTVDLAKFSEFGRVEWELAPSRGVKFPHLYFPEEAESLALDMRFVTHCDVVRKNDDGVHSMPDYIE
ncbi:MAG: hypothetical protein MHM6MM_004154 [Cercozoa sp. M6MM]